MSNKINKELQDFIAELTPEAFEIFIDYMNQVIDLEEVFRVAGCRPYTVEIMFAEEIKEVLLEGGPFYGC